MRIALIVAVSTLALLATGIAISDEPKPTIEDRLLILERMASHTANQSIENTEKLMRQEDGEVLHWSFKQIVEVNAEIGKLRSAVMDLRIRVQLLESVIDGIHKPH